MGLIQLNFIMLRHKHTSWSFKLVKVNRFSDSPILIAYSQSVLFLLRASLKDFEHSTLFVIVSSIHFAGVKHLKPVQGSCVNIWAIFPSFLLPVRT